MTVAAVGTLAALAAALVAQFAANNVLVQQAILPALLPTVAALTGASSPSYVAPRGVAISTGGSLAGAPAGVAPYLTRGVALQLRAAGPRCGALVSLSFSGLLGGAIVNTSSIFDAASLEGPWPAEGATVTYRPLAGSLVARAGYATCRM